MDARAQLDHKMGDGNTSLHLCSQMGAVAVAKELRGGVRPQGQWLRAKG